MPNTKQILTVSKGITSDISDKYLDQSMSTYRMNVRVISTNSGNDLDAETILGNTLVSFTLPIGSNTVIGNYEDKNTHKNYVCVYNSNGKHTVYEYDQEANTISMVMLDFAGSVADKILRFRPTHLITAMNVVDGVLYITDNYVNPDDENDYNEPKQIDIEKGKAYCAGDYVNGYPNTSWEEFRLYLTQIVQPPLEAPTYEWSGLNEYLIVANSADHLYDPVTEIFPFNNASTNIGGEFDTSTYTWTATVSSAGRKVIGVWMSVEDSSGFVTTFDIYVNGVDVATYVAPASATGVYYLQYIGNIAAGDTVNVYCNNGGLPETYFGRITNSFTVIDSDGEINYWFKKLPVFQVGNVHINHKKSTLSPISRYVFPKTQIAPNSSGEDYVMQDNKVTVHIPTGIATVRKLRLYVKILGTTTEGDNPTELGFSLVTELDKDKLQIPDNSIYDYVYLNDTQTIPVDANETELLYSNVPLYAKAQEMGNGKEFIANNTEGFQPINTDWRFDVDYVVLNSPANSFFVNTLYRKAGGVYTFGEINYDETGLRSGVTWRASGKTTEKSENGIYGTQLFIPFLTQPDYAPSYTPSQYGKMKYVPKITIKIFNRPNGNAKKYQIASTKNQASDYWIQFTSQSTMYHDANGNTVPPALATTVDISIGNILGRYKTENPSSTLSYTWVKGDRLRFIAKASGFSGQSSSTLEPFYIFNDTEIESTRSDIDGQLIVIPMTTSVPQDMPTTGVGLILYEIYRPSKLIGQDNELTYEIGDEGNIITDANGNLVHEGDGNGTDQLISTCISVTNTALDTYTCIVPNGSQFSLNDPVKIITDSGNIYGVISVIAVNTITIDTTGETITGDFSDNSGDLIRAATFVLTGGDCFRRLTNMPVDLVSAPSVWRLYAYTEVMNASNMFTSNAYDYGRPNRIDWNDKRRTLPATIRFSQNFIENTSINGLNMFLPLDFKDYYSTLGSIQKMFFHNQSLDLFQQIKIQNVPISQNIMSGNTGQIIIGSSQQVRPDQTKIMAYSAEFGIGINPESFAYFENARYGADVIHSAIWRLSLDGIVNLTEKFGMSVFWADVCDKILKCPNKVPVYGVFDVRFKEYIVSVPPFVYGFEQIFNGCTLAFNETTNQFSTFYSYIPENMGNANQNIITFKDGKLWLHNTNDSIATFYGIKTEPELEFVCNLFPENEKVFLALEETSDDVWVCPSITTPKGQETRIVYPSNWDTKENIHYAYIKKDIHTPVVPNPIVRGNPMRDTTCRIRLKYLGNSFSTFHSLNVYLQNSPRHNQ